MNEISGTIKVVCREGEDIDSLVSRFKKSVKRSRKLLELREHEYAMTNKERREFRAKMRAITRR